MHKLTKNERYHLEGVYIMMSCLSTLGLHFFFFAMLVMGAAEMNASGSESQDSKAPLNWGGVQEGFRMGIHGEENQTVSIKKAIILVVTMKNVSDTPLKLVETGSLKDYRITVQDEKGDDVPLTLYGRMLSDSRREILLRRMKRVAPGETLVHEFHVNRIFDMSLTGKYYIHITRMVPKRNGDGFVDVMSNRIIMTVAYTDNPRIGGHGTSDQPESASAETYHTLSTKIFNVNQDDESSDASMVDSMKNPNGNAEQCLSDASE